MDPQNDIPGVPPPPAEVKVRTMHSDIESMKMSGGGLPQFQNVTIEGLAMEREIPAAASPGAGVETAHGQPVPGISPSSATPEASEVTASHSSHKALGVILVIVVAIIAVLAISYFAYKELGNSGTGSQVSPAGQSTAG